MTWFWIVTLTWNTPAGQATCSANGTLTPEQAAALGSRTNAYPAVIDAGRRAMNVPDGTVSTVLFLTIEPDALTASAVSGPAGGGS